MIFRKYGKVFFKIKYVMAIKTSRDNLSYFKILNAHKKVDKTGVE